MLWQIIEVNQNLHRKKVWKMSTAVFTIDAEGNGYNKKQIIRMYKFTFWIQKRVLKKILQKDYDRKKVNSWIDKSVKDLEELIPKMPYIGGNENTFTKFLVSPSILLPMSKIMREEEIPKRKIGQFIYEMAKKGYHMVPKFIRKRNAKNTFKEETKQNWREEAKKTQKKQYPEDWVSTYVEGDGDNYQYGLDMTECGLLKFWKSQGMEEFVPYLCLCDWAFWKATGIEVQRTETLANGGKKCDYRYIGCNKKELQSGWPPEDMTEWSGKFES